MRSFKMLTYENISCWYELSWDAEHVGIIFRLHKEFIAKTKPIPEDAPIIEVFQGGFETCNAFYTGFDRDFGFDGVFLYLGEKDDFVEFFVKIPAVKLSLNETCERCDGDKVDPSLGDECMHCDGLGLEREFHWGEAYKISASFTVLTMFIAHPDMETSSHLPQLMTVQTVTQQGLHGGTLGGEYSIPLVQWLTSIPPNMELKSMTQAMRQAWDHMFVLSKSDRYTIRNHIPYETGWLNVDIPGNACGLHPAWGAESNMKEGRGYAFDCHNTDSPMQQLTLLAGLAALHDLAREAIDLDI